MKKKLTPFPGTGGPALSIDLTDISLIEEYGSRTGKAEWVEAVITLRSGKQVKINLNHADMDDLLDKWENGTAQTEPTTPAVTPIPR